MVLCITVSYICLQQMRPVRPEEMVSQWVPVGDAPDSGLDLEPEMEVSPSSQIAT